MNCLNSLIISQLILNLRSAMSDNLVKPNGVNDPLLKRNPTKNRSDETNSGTFPLDIKLI